LHKPCSLSKPASIVSSGYAQLAEGRGSQTKNTARKN
jgi:hypothetical protein